MQGYQRLRHDRRRSFSCQPLGSGMTLELRRSVRNPEFIHLSRLAADLQALLRTRSAPHRKSRVACAISLWVIAGPGSKGSISKIWVRKSTMEHIETLPGESSASIISSIINLVCPQCGGSMIEYQCNGRCRKNWLPEWEWANFETSRSGRTGRRSANSARAAKNER